MAKRVDALPEKPSNYPKYPWDDWLNGEAWELHRGEDFPGEVYTFCTVVRNAAARRSLNVTILRGEHDRNIVYVQARPR
jgi:hypothetical protein